MRRLTRSVCVTGCRAGVVGASTVFFLYAVACLVSVVFIAACVPETKDRSLEQVDDAVAVQQQRMIRTYDDRADTRVQGGSETKPLRLITRASLKHVREKCSADVNAVSIALSTYVKSTFFTNLFHHRLPSGLWTDSTAL